MGPKKKLKATVPCPSPAQKSAKAISKKYRGKRMTPEKVNRVRRALYSVCNKEMTVRKAAKEYGLSYGFLYRRYSGEVDINKIKGPKTVFTEAEEEKMAHWLSEMAQRGMGLKRCEFLDFVQDIVKKEKRKTPFKDGRPSEQWYEGFKNRNSHIIDTRSETPLELKRSKVTKDVTDKWYSNFRDFLTSINCLDKPSCIWNADETGFNMGSNKSRVIGPASRKISVPHITAGKQRLTVMFCGSASGQLMPPFLVYPEPAPRSYNPLNGATEGSAIAYTKKGWMDAQTFSKFIDHFDKFAGTERPVVLLMDSVSSHVDHSVFMKARSKGIELYKLVPNATHLMQPLDKGVFGPLKTKWHLMARKYSRENPGRSIGKENFAEKLKETCLQFYKPLIIVNAFKAAGIFPVDASVITPETLKPGQTYLADEPTTSEVNTGPPTVTLQQEQTPDNVQARGALRVFEETLTTPLREKYKKRIEEGYDIQDKSPCFDVFKRLHDKAFPLRTKEIPTASSLDILANVALQDLPGTSIEELSAGVSSSSQEISPIITGSLVYPKAPESQKPVKKTLLKLLPDNLTAPDSIRTMSLKELEKVRGFAEKEHRAKQSYLKKQIKENKKSKRSGPAPKGSSKINLKKGKRSKKTKTKCSEDNPDSEDSAFCKGCLVTWKEDMLSGQERLWAQCDSCDGWLHAECVSEPIDEEGQFICPDCYSN